MRVRWTTDAAEDLERICDHIAQEHPDSARRVAESVVGRLGDLERFPRIGRSGRVAGTREIAFPPLPYVAVYEILGGSR
jgi:toxin ParE1/3/4